MRKKPALRRKEPSRSKVPPPQDKKHPQTLWARISHASTAYGLIPPSFIQPTIGATMMGFLAFVAKLPPVWIASIFLGSAAAVVVILHYASSKKVAYSIFSALAVLVLITSYNSYNSYNLSFEGVSVGLYPTTLDRGSASGAGVDVKFRNANSFVVWYRADRRRVIIDGMTQSDDSGAMSDHILAMSLVGIRADPVIFRKNLLPREIQGGSVDYDICYGRTKSNLTKRLSVQSSFELRFDEFDRISVVFFPMSIKESDCD
jgi:hypothetical protein